MRKPAQTGGCRLPLVAHLLQGDVRLFAVASLQIQGPNVVPSLAIVRFQLDRPGERLRVEKTRACPIRTYSSLAAIRFFFILRGRASRALVEKLSRPFEGRVLN
jgi:hypothetical protein